MPQLAAIDLDGTLLRSDGNVSERSIAALRAFLKGSGRSVVLASGQPPASILRTASKILAADAGDAYCVASGGATVARVPSGEIVYRNWVPASALTRLIPQIRELEPELRLTIEAESWITSNMDFFQLLDRLMPGVGAKLARLGREEPLLERAVDGEAVRLLILSPNSEAGSTERMLARLKPLVDRENLRGSNLSLTSPGGGEGALQLTPVGVDKVRALEWLCERSGLVPDQVVAFGDHLNDNAMLRWAGRGVAMGNAQPETKKCADEVTVSNDEDGVAVVLEQMELLNSL